MNTSRTHILRLESPLFVRHSSSLRNSKIVSNERVVAGGVQNIFNGEFGWKSNVFVESKNLSRYNAIFESLDCTLFLPVWAVAFTTRCFFLKS
jgi:hypothetical protein